MLNLWHFAREFNERENSVSLPSFVCIAFANPEMARRIREDRDLAIHVIGRCAQALVVNKLAADLISRNVPVGNDELTCLSAILGTKSRYVMHLLDHPSAIEFTNMVFLALDDFYSFALETVPSYVLDVVQQTSIALNARMRLNQTDALMSVSDGQCDLVLISCLYCLKMCVRDLISHGYNV